jgi:hypothetical protein
MADVVSNWRIDEVPVATGGAVAGVRRSAAAQDIHLEALLGGQFEVERVFHATSPQRRSTEPAPPMTVTVPAEPGGLYLLAIRHEGSGALSFHRPQLNEEAVRRGVTVAASLTADGFVTFQVQFANTGDPGLRRSLSLNPIKMVKGIVLKVAGVVADIAVPWIGSKGEDAIWNFRRLPRGWLQVTKETLRSGQLAPANFEKITSSNDRCLLLLHGTFSDAAGAFGALCSTQTPDGRDFFTEVAATYGDRIYAFNHFSVSMTPQQNAQNLIDNLPKLATFDVITHSRGGLVLRNLAERQDVLGPKASYFKLGNAVLVASPNVGTPLATADRFEDFLSWWANLIELFPANPWTTAADYVISGLNFLARHLVDALPGLEAMDMHGQMIGTLNGSTGAPAGSTYFALASNYSPTKNVLARIADLGLDAFFDVANDLVVPCEGSWKVSAHRTWIAGAQIGCFGLNLNSVSATDGVIHTAYFSQPETVDFLIEALLGKPLGLKTVDVDLNLPFFLRRSAQLAAQSATAALDLAPAVVSSGIDKFSGFVKSQLAEADDVMHLFLISADDHLPADVRKKSADRTAILLATYRNARVVETIFLRGGTNKPAGTEDGNFHWNKIIATNEQIKNYVDGKPNAKRPTNDNLHDLGVNLFNAMFPGMVKRLYDAARVDRLLSGGRLDVVITSMIDWVADKPWEFAYDKSRESFLATESVNFTRNVLTAVPAQVPIEHPDKPLKLLVVVAQPVGLGLLSVDDELRVVRRGFEALIDAGLVEVEFMMRTHIDEVHERLRKPDIDILHFVGHGEYDPDKDEGYLIFEDPDGRVQRVSSDSLRQVMCLRGLRLIFLNACETGMVGSGDRLFDFNRGVAPKLVAGGVPVLVANQYKVLDVSATEFAKHFYRWLALGATVGDAAREARVAVNYSVKGENIDWAVPVVYARNPGRMIYSETEANHVMKRLKSSFSKSATQVCRGFQGVKIGLWDVNNVLPHLDQFCAKISKVQSNFCFQTVDVSAPIGTWRTQPPVGKEVAMQGTIHGDEVAEKLRDHVSSLGVDRLICITAFALSDNADDGLALWNQDPMQTVSIISGDMVFNQPEQPYPLLDRFLANMIVSALCGIEGHDDPPPNCPQHNPGPGEKDLVSRFKNNTAKCEFCPKCVEKFGAKASSMNAILKAY